MQKLMAAAKMDAVLLTAAADIQYFSGFQTRFWQSPTRPWFLALPAKGAPVAVIPEIGKALMQKTHITDIRCWPSPRPQDEGISLLAELLNGWSGRGGKIGIPKIGMALGAESAARMPLLDWLKLRAALSGEIADCAEMLQRQRMIKSPREIDKIRHSAKIVSAAFAELPNRTKNAASVRQICAQLQADILLNGADEVPYLAAAFGGGGYQSVITPPDDKIPATGDIIFIDIGAVFDGYFCDFNRNFVFGKAAAKTAAAHAILGRALRAGIAAARPGKTAAAVWRAMRAEIPAAGNIGRMGHGVGLQLTEPPSITENDETELRAGMVLAVEPSIQTGGGVMVREENIAIRETGEAELLTVAAGDELPVIKQK
ncbi:MAG: aminopeptidase P family protein [Betaproteobacteria bacterium]|nr:aminopeptidase P family protein [Betaproteobacteria bacterium]